MSEDELREAILKLEDARNVSEDIMNDDSISNNKFVAALSVQTGSLKLQLVLQEHLNND